MHFEMYINSLHAECTLQNTFFYILFIQTKKNEKQNCC